MSDKHTKPASDTPRHLYAQHPRLWQDFTYVYPVISRRAGGLSIGINLNIDNACNFDCVYCCVDRAIEPPRRDVDLAQVRDELDQMLSMATSGKLWRCESMTDVPTALRRINDIAFSGNGEPTAYKHFDKAVQLAVDLKKAYQLDETKIIVITNATMFDRPTVQRGLALMDQNQGEVWAKLDAGSQEYFQQIDRTKFPLSKVLKNIAACGRGREIVIQTILAKLHGQAMSEQEFDLYLDRVDHLLQAGCQIKAVQLYTVARQTAQTWVGSIDNAMLDELADRARRRLGQLTVSVHYGVE